MKRIILVLAIALILCASAFDSGDCRQTPWGYQDPAIDQGEDHPWGGEHNNLPPDEPTVASIGGGSDHVGTGYFLIDFWFSHLFDVWDVYVNQPQNDQRHADPKDDNATGSTISAKGN
jgi:hypothetical protein